MSGFAQHKASVFVGIPSFIGNTPEPAQMGSKIKSTLSDLKDAGYEGDYVLLAGHSLGGVMA